MKRQKFINYISLLALVMSLVLQPFASTSGILAAQEQTSVTTGTETDIETGDVTEATDSTTVIEPTEESVDTTTSETAETSVDESSQTVETEETEKTTTVETSKTSTNASETEGTTAETSSTTTGTTKPSTSIDKSNFDIGLNNITENLVTDVSITVGGLEVESGQNIEIDTNAKTQVAMTYTISRPENFEIESGDIFTIDIPSVLEIGDSPKHLPLEIRGVEIATYDITNGKLNILFNDNVIGFDDFTANVNFIGTVDTTIFDDNNPDVIEIPMADNTSFTLELTPEPTGEAEGEDRKTAGSPYIINAEGNKVETSKNPSHVDWTVRANNDAETLTNAKIVDNLDDSLTIDLDSVVVERIIYNYRQQEIAREIVPAAEYTVQATSTGFEVILAGGELGTIENAYDISYTTEITRPNGGGPLEINNDAAIVLNDNTNPVSDRVSVEFSGDIPIIDKTGALDGTHKDIINWTVEYNYGRENLGEMTLTDSLTEGVVVPGTIVITQVDTNIDGEVINDIENITPVFDADGNLVLDAEGKAYKITYQSQAPIGLNGPVTNTVSDNYIVPNTDEATVEVNTIPTGGKVAEQHVDENGQPYIEWKITLNTERITVDGIRVHDVFDPTLLELDWDSFELTKDGVPVTADNFTTTPYSYEGEDTALEGFSGFTLGVPEAGDSVYVLTYRTNYTVKGMQEPEIANHAELLFDGGPGIGQPVSVKVEGPKSGISKYGQYRTSSDNTEQTIRWTIDFNRSEIDLEKAKLTDKFTEGDYTYINETIHVYELDGGTERELTADKFEFTVDADLKGFVLEIYNPTNAKYRVVYDTTADALNNLQKNEVDFEWQGGTEATEATVVSRVAGLNKSGNVVVDENENPVLDSNGDKAIDWVVNFNTNRQVLTKFKLVDTYNPSTSTASDIRVLKDGVALVAGTDYNLIETSATDGTFTIEIAKLDAVPYQLTYTTSLSPEEEASVDNVNNSVSITYDNGSENTSHNIATPKIKVPKRVAEFNKNLDNDSNPLISWEIRVNTDRANKWANMINPVITDDIPVDQRLIQDSFVVTRVNGPVLTETDYVLTTSDNQFTIDLPDGPYEYTITYDTEILVYPSAHDTNYDRYTNRGTLTTDNYPEKVFTAHQDYFSRVDPNDILTKSAQQSDETENIVWKLVLNPDGLTIANYKIVDTLTSSNHTFVEDSVIVTDEAGNDITEQYDIAFDIDESERSRLTITPKEVNGESPSLTAPIGVQYDTRLNPDEIGSNITVSNSASLWGGDKGNINEGEPINGAGSQWFYGGGGSGRTLEFNIHKQADENTPIAGVRFLLSRLNYDGSVANESYFTSDELGNVSITEVRAGRYILEELTVEDEGYQVLENPVYFVARYASPTENETSGDYILQLTAADFNVNNPVDSNVAQVSHSVDNGALLTIDNDVKTDIETATKVWVGEGTHPSALFKLQRSEDGGLTWQDVPGTTTLEVGNTTNSEVTVEWTGIEQFYYEKGNSETSAFEFRVVEVNAEGNEFTPTGYVKVEDGLTVTNTAISELNTPVILANKQLTGRPLRNEEFTFILSDATDEVTRTTNNVVGGEVRFEDFLTQAQIQSIVDNGNQTFDFTISELSDPGVAGVTHDDTEYNVQLVAIFNSTNNNITYAVNNLNGPPVFRNTYQAEPITTQVEVTKSLTGQELVVDQFTFELLDSSNAVVDTATNDAEGNVVFTTFAEHEFTEAGRYSYTVREVSGDLGGVSYDSREFDFTVIVTDDGSGQLAANIEYLDGPINFTNTYTAEPVSIDVEVTKSLTGQELRDGQFTFNLEQDADDTTTVLDTAQTATNNADGTIDFAEIEFTQTGTYNFTVTEVAGNLGGVEYDTEPINVQVVVTDDGTGNLVATVTYAGEDTTFNNTYTAQPVVVDFSANKTLNGQALADNQFEFTLSATNDAALAVLPNAQVVMNTADGNVDFTPVQFTTVGTYVFEIDETEDNTNGITSDERVYVVTVTVTDDGEGQLVADVNYDIEGQTGYDYTEDTAHFTNTYAATPTSLVLEASKVAEHLNLNDNEFTFVLTGDGVSQEKQLQEQVQ